MLETVSPVRCLVTGSVFDFDFDFDFDFEIEIEIEIDPGFEFDFQQGFAFRAAHQNDLPQRLVRALIPGRQLYLTLAQKKVACCDAARYFVFSFKSSRIIANQA